MAQVTEQGYVARTLPEIIESLTELFKGVYGADISVAPDTPDGQFIGILAQMFSDYEEIGAAVYKQLDPSSATGRWLEQRAAYVGVYKNKGLSSTLPAVQIDAKEGTYIPNGYTVTDGNNIKWIIVSPTTVGANEFTYANFISEETGVFSVPVGTSLRPSIQVSGVTRVSSTVLVIPGNNRDTDPALRNKLLARKLLVNSAVCTKIMDALYKVKGVVTAVAYENPEEEVNLLGMPRKSIWVIVDGGLDTDIANVIISNKTGGAKLKGAVTTTIIDDYGIARPVSYDRFIPIGLKAKVTLVRSEGVVSIDSGMVEKLLLDYIPGASADVYLSRVISIINQVPGFWVKTLLIGKGSSTPTADNIIVGPQESARFTSVEIVVE